LGLEELNEINDDDIEYIDAVVINADNQSDQAVSEVMSIIAARKAQN